MKVFVLPYKGLCKIPGAELGPIEVSKSLSFYSAHQYQIKFLNDFSNPSMFQSFQCEFEKSIHAKERFVIVGGDHSTTSYVFSILLDHKKDYSCIIFDAHNDYSFENTSELYNWNVINHIEEYVKEGIVVGYRDIHESMPECKKFQYFYDYHNSEEIKERVINICRKSKNLYLSIDVDVLNPIEFPGTGYKVAGGLFLRELIEYIELIKANTQNLIIDIAEFNPLIEKEISLRSLQRIIDCIAHE